ncbi:AraC family transcriptional regulator [Paenibacillus sp. PL2-23]|uniref:helix-turn-helix transcriptional regulator n=1 Tax=Paenibacillus sp. PL2-23 TaxID=2100729 RepID=UPI0030F614DC
MHTSYGFKYTADEGQALYKLVSIGHGAANEEAYCWNGLQREGSGLIFQYTLKGAGKLRVGGNSYTVARGHAFIVQIPGDHEYGYDAELSSEEWEFLWIRFEALGEIGMITDSLGHLGPVVELGPELLPIQLLWRLYEDIAGKRIGDRFDLSVRIYEWVASLQRCLASSGVYAASEIPLAYRQAADFIEQSYGQDLTLDQLADAAGLSKFHLSKSFSRYYGVSPMDYVRNRRIEQAAELLRATALSITDIGTRCGFSNVSYFGKVFHKMTGMTPTAYREAKEGQVQNHLRLLE